MSEPGLQFTPDNLEIVFLSFEGPDQPYSQAGGLGVRVSNFTRSLARAGFATHLFFVGDPDLPDYETREDGRLHLHRWSQWVSAYHRAGVYDGEIEKVHDYQDSVPGFVTDHVVRPAVEAGRRVAVIAEDWHTGDALARLSDSLNFVGLRRHTVIIWNANNDLSFDRINWGRIGYVADFATVSRYVKHQMWAHGVDPVVIPNGIPARAADLWFFKIGRMDPDKGWIPAVEAIHRLRERGVNARLVMKPGGLEAHGGEVLGHMAWRGLHPQDVATDDRSVQGIATALASADPEAAILDLKFFVPDEVLPALYAAADGVLANSGYEPFGLVGLEAMAAGGVAYVGSTGEDYALPLQNAVVLDDVPDPEEIVQMALTLRDQPELAGRIRASARETAERFIWEAIIPLFLTKLRFVADRQGMDRA